jgi:hypothetical protein
LSTASQRSFKLKKHKFARESLSKFKKNQVGQSGGHIVGAGKYIKNVMNIPSYMQDKAGLTMDQNYESMYQHSIDDSLL